MVVRCAFGSHPDRSQRCRLRQDVLNGLGLDCTLLGRSRCAEGSVANCANHRLMGSRAAVACRWDAHLLPQRDLLIDDEVGHVLSLLPGHRLTGRSLRNK